MSASGPYKKILYEVRDGVAHITLNLPEQLNPLGIGPGSMREEISHALAIANDDEDIGCVVIDANGKAFSAGGDLSTAVANESVMQAQRFGRKMLQFYEGVRSIEKPVIAAVQGLCIGAGLGLIAQCDLVVASDDARFGLIEGRIGFPGAAELVPVIGPTWAKFLIYTGEMIDAPRAERIGLVLAVEAADCLKQRSHDLAARIARMPLETLALNKASINAVTDARGSAAGRIAGRAHENLVLTSSKDALAPDGRRFSDILRTDGIAGIKQARDQQFTGSWLKPGGAGTSTKSGSGK
jgi:enoyl-CoA hydratase/carnithine racemase